MGLRSETCAAGQRQIEGSVGDGRGEEMLPPGQHAVEGFPRFGTHLNLRAPAVPARHAIEICGAAVDKRTVPLAQLAALPRRELTADLHCVSGWSATALRWEGVPFASFYRELIEPALAPDQDPTHFVFEGLDGYRVVVAIEDALADDVLIAEQLDGRPLTADHGAPVRLVSPSQYGYVSAKHLARIEVCTEAPAENFGHVHPLGRAALRGPLFQRHPRGRVWREERHRYLPGWAIRAVYAAIRPPIRWLSARGSEDRAGASRGRPS
jgi:DMSO/TMAO reductase YedYZ molybdopterin-dependent catalytic subunit